MNNNFEIRLSPSQPQKSGTILFEAVSKNTQKEVRVNIVKLLVKQEEEGDFREVDDFKILASGPVEKTFRMDLDPLETRSYGVQFECIVSYDFQIFARDKDGCEFICEGNRSGVPAGELAKANEEIVKSPLLNATVRVPPTSYRRLPGTFIIEPEDGTPNDFGIFNKHDINPTAAYIALGRDGYKTLKGKFMAELDWDRDTVANPPDDLVAVHIRNTETREHGWLFRSSLLIEKSSSS